MSFKAIVTKVIACNLERHCAVEVRLYLSNLILREDRLIHKLCTA